MRRGWIISQILFSILIPVYNVEKFIDQCINSVLQQTYRNFEVILIDDGSKDDSGKLCDKYSKLDRRIKVWHQDNEGLLMTRRNAISKAKGDYYLFLDSDDFWEDELLETINNMIVEYYCDMVIFNCRKVYPGKSVNLIEKPVFKNYTVFDKDNKSVIFTEILSGCRLNRLALKAVKSNIIDYVDYSKYKQVKTAEDLLQSLPLLYNAEKILYIDKPLYNYRINPDSITHIFDVNELRDVTITRNVVLEYIRRMNLDSDKNMGLFYTYYIKCVLNYVSQIIKADMDSDTRKSLFLSIKEYDIYQNTQNIKMNRLKLSMHEWFELILFRRNLIGCLSIYDSTAHSLYNNILMLGKKLNAQ